MFFFSIDTHTHTTSNVAAIITALKCTTVVFAAFTIVMQLKFDSMVRGQQKQKNMNRIELVSERKAFAL